MMLLRRASMLTAVLLLGLASVASAAITVGEVQSEQKISELFGNLTPGNLGGTLADADQFGSASAGIGDLNKDGVADMVVGAPLDDGTGTDQGAVYILFLRPNGKVRTGLTVKITGADLPVALDDDDRFGSAVAGIGDLDRDGNPDIAVGAPRDDDGTGNNRGAIYILFLNANGTVKATQKISSDEGDFDATAVSGNDRFGSAIGVIGRLDGDLNPDLVVGAKFDNGGGTNRGAAHVLFMRQNGKVKSQTKITEADVGGLDDNDWFGFSAAGVGDADNDGNPDVAIGAPQRDLTHADQGNLYLILMNADGTVASVVEESIEVTDDEFFAWSIVWLDIHPGMTVLAVGSPGNDTGGNLRGAVWLLTADNTATFVGAPILLAEGQNGFVGPLGNGDRFGSSLAAIRDVNGDLVTDLAVGARADDDGGLNRGAMYVLALAGVPALPHAFTFLANDEFDLDEPHQTSGNLHSNDDITFDEGESPFSRHRGRLTAVDDIDIGPDVRVVGSARAGDDLDIDASSTVTGAKVAGANILPVPMPVVPAFTTNLNDIEVEDGETRNLGPGRYGHIEVEEGATLNLRAGTYRIKSLNIDDESILCVDVDNGPVTMNVEGEFDLEDEVTVVIKNVPVAGVPGSRFFTVRSAGDDDTDIEIGEESIFYGNIIAPGADAELEEDSRFQGTLAAGDIDVEDHARFVPHDFSGAPVFPLRAPLDESFYVAHGEAASGLADIKVGKGSYLMLKPARYDDVRVKDRGTVTMLSGTYDADKLVLGDEAVLKLDVSRGPITINLTKDLEFGSGVEMRLQPEDASSELVRFNYSGDRTIVAGSESQIVGQIDAPQAKVKLGENVQLVGDVRAAQVTRLAGAAVLGHRGVSEPVETLAAPLAFTLEQNYPNPARLDATIGFALPKAGQVTLQIYGVDGRLVKTLVNGAFGAGRHTATWDGRDASGRPAPAGLYFYKLDALDAQGQRAFTQTRRMTLVK